MFDAFTIGPSMSTFSGGCRVCSFKLEHLADFRRYLVLLVRILLMKLSLHMKGSLLYGRETQWRTSTNTCEANCESDFCNCVGCPCEREFCNFVGEMAKLLY